jgi:thiopurine S-methyltransferase
MEKSFWQSRWDDGQIGFHQDAVHPQLATYFSRALSGRQVPDRDTSEGAHRPQRVLVPLCGKSLDLTWLETQGNEVLGVEFVEKAAREYFESRGLVPKVSTKGDAIIYEASGVTIVVGDFFAVSPDSWGRVDAIYDRAALVALAPEQRKPYVARLAKWLRPGGKLFLISFEHDMGSGPPFSVPETQDLLRPFFEVEPLHEEDVLDAEPRFRQRGATYLRESVLLGTLEDTTTR